MVDLDVSNNLNISNKFLFLDGYGIDVRVDDGKLMGIQINNIEYSNGDKDTQGINN